MLTHLHAIHVNDNHLGLEGLPDSERERVNVSVLVRNPNAAQRGVHRDGVCRILSIHSESRVHQLVFTAVRANIPYQFHDGSTTCSELTMLS